MLHNCHQSVSLGKNSCHTQVTFLIFVCPISYNTYCTSQCNQFHKPKASENTNTSEITSQYCMTSVTIIYYTFDIYQNRKHKLCHTSKNSVV